MKIHHIAITVNHLAESVSFYSKLFGFKQTKLFERSDLKGKAVFLECENVMLELWEFPGTQKIVQHSDLKDIGIRHVAFEVSSVTDFVADLPSHIAVSQVKKGASGGSYVFLKDPTGIDIEIYEPN